VTDKRTGRFDPVIDPRYPFATIADAYHYVETVKKAGVTVIDIVWEVDVPSRREERSNR